MNREHLAALAFLIMLLCISNSGQARPTYCDHECTFSSCGTQECTHPETGNIITCSAWGTYNTSDIDCDGVTNPADNCPSVSNPGQENCDGDDLGDVCDPLYANYVYSGADLCVIFGTSVFNESWVNRQFRTHYEDSSACGAPDFYDYVIEPARICPEEPNDYQCCVDYFGIYTCSVYFEIWHCS